MEKNNNNNKVKIKLTHSASVLPSMSDEQEPPERSPRAVVFCQAPRLELPPIRHAVGMAHVTLSDPCITLRDYRVKAQHVYGHCHPNNDDVDSALCLLCMQDLSEFHPFLKLAEINLAKEREAIANFLVDNRGVVRDASTWLAARIDWQITSIVHGFFAHYYPIIAATYDKVNTLSPLELDGRLMTAWSESGFRDETARPRYCSWLFIPDTIADDNIGNLRMFYISTRHPLETDVLTYLFTVLRPPKALIQAIATFTNKSEYLVNYLGFNDGLTRSRQHSRTQSAPKRLASPEPPIELTLAGYETHDPRDARANREAEMSSAILKRMQNLTTRLILYSTDTRIITLQPRTDYILVPHTHYLNVFCISLPEHAEQSFKIPQRFSDPVTVNNVTTTTTTDERW